MSCRTSVDVCRRRSPTALCVPAQSILRLLLSFVPKAAAAGEPCTPFMELLRWALGRKADSQVSMFAVQAQWHSVRPRRPDQVQLLCLHFVSNRQTI